MNLNPTFKIRIEQITYLCPEDLGGCGKSRLSDIAQVQKWQYLHSIAHLNDASATVVTSLLQRALNATVTDSSYYCSSLVHWGSKMGLHLIPAPLAPLRLAGRIHCSVHTTNVLRPVYTHSSFSIIAPLFDVLSLTSTELTTRFARATTGVYLPASHGASRGASPVALFIRTPPGSATDVNY